MLIISEGSLVLIVEFTTRSGGWAGNSGRDTLSLRGLGLEARLQLLLCEEARDLRLVGK